MQIVIVNNTKEDLRSFQGVFADCIKNDVPLPEEINDIFSLNIMTVGNEKRGIVNFL